jgi:hypothetical protein
MRLLLALILTGCNPGPPPAPVPKWQVIGEEEMYCYYKPPDTTGMIYRVVKIDTGLVDIYLTRDSVIWFCLKSDADSVCREQNAKENE